MATRYITGASNEFVRAIARDYEIGLMLTPDTAEVRKTKSRFGPAGLPGGYANAKHLDAFGFYVLDNGGFGAKGKPFIPKWWEWLTALDRALTPEEKARVLFATAPDVLDWFPAFNKDGTPKMITKGPDKGKQDVFCVGRAAPTLELFREWAPKIKALGFPVALVAQDGLEDMLDDVSWDLVDWIFIGGSDDFKIGEAARLVTKRAHYEGKRVHMGRVNSGERLAIANSWGVDTADGTYLAFGPIENLPNVLEWIDAVNNRDPLPCYAMVAKRREVWRKENGRDPKTGKKLEVANVKKAA